jgi:DNA-binding NarL/FixJ family response regulator
MPHTTNATVFRGNDTHVNVGIVDDDPASRAQVKEFLNGSESCFRCEVFPSPEGFYESPRCEFDLFVFDEFYDETRMRRAAELVEYSTDKFPEVPIIIFSDYPDPTSIARSERVSAFVDKLKSNQDPSSFRREVNRALRLSHRLPDNLLSRVTHYLQEKDAHERQETEERISDITMGNVIYPFKVPLAVIAEWDLMMTNCQFFLKAHPGFLVGRGPDSGSARSAFYGRFHERFQKLFCQSPLYDSLADASDRVSFLDIVNVEHYQGLRTVFVPNCYGQIKEIAEDGIRTIAWWEGPATSHRLDDVPTLANLRIDDWVRAAVEKRVATGAVVRLVHASLTSAPKYTLERRDAFWNRNMATHET